MWSGEEHCSSAKQSIREQTHRTPCIAHVTHRSQYSGAVLVSLSARLRLNITGVWGVRVRSSATSGSLHARVAGMSVPLAPETQVCLSMWLVKRLRCVRTETGPQFARHDPTCHDRDVSLHSSPTHSIPLRVERVSHTYGRMLRVFLSFCQTCAFILLMAS